MIVLEIEVGEVGARCQTPDTTDGIAVEVED